MSKDIINLESDIINAATSLIIASCTLRSCYCEEDSSNEDFRRLRSQVTNYAKVYEKKILPFANIVVRRIEDFCDNYRVLSFEEFIEDLPNLAEEANNYVNVCKYTLELHEAILTDFKIAKDSATKIIKQMDLETQWLEWRQQSLVDASEKNFGWAGILFFVPGVNLIATPILIAKGIKKDEEAIAAAEEVSLVYKAVQVIESSLVPSIDEFIKSLAAICGFFNILANELTILAENHHQENTRRTHYKKIKAKADEIVKACRYYMSQIPDCETNLRAIPDKYDKNYVQEWLSRKRVSTETSNNELPLAVLGRKLFASDKSLINLIN